MPDLHPSIAHLPMPDRIKALPVDDRGYPIPHFVAVVNGVPDHRIMDASKLPRAVRERRCWLCGEPLGRYLTSLIGPMCAVTRTIAEPPSHRECAQYAAVACPFLSRPHAHRREAGLPEEAEASAGLALQRNPGVVCLWTSRTPPQPFRVENGVLFRIGEPTSVEWYAEGRPATRSEVHASIESGLPALQTMAHAEGPRAEKELAQMVARAMPFLPQEEVVCS